MRQAVHSHLTAFLPSKSWDGGSRRDSGSLGREVDQGNVGLDGRLGWESMAEGSLPQDQMRGTADLETGRS